jgi:hypothetical protein
MTPKITPEALAELIAPMLAGTYHCNRVWDAWRVGTMSEADFARVDESDTPHKIAAAPLATPDDLAMAALLAVAACPVDSTHRRFVVELHRRIARREEKLNG